MATLVFDDTHFCQSIQDTPLASWGALLSEAVMSTKHGLTHGHLTQWQQAVACLPERSSPCHYDLDHGAIHIRCSIQEDEYSTCMSALEALRPWRKGPFRFDTIAIDSEWRSDWKWERLAAEIQPLSGRSVLDVGCGNGYYLWRMYHEGASFVLGIDPSLLYLMQFDATQHFIQNRNVQFLPIPMETLPGEMRAFDTIFSMGVLYHRRDPLSHLRQLRQALKDDGELVLETLVIADETDDLLMIENRYANMRNVYELPSMSRLERWLKAGGFEQSKIVSIATTSCEEQRSTEWMTSHSLQQAIDKTDPQKTIEGHPRPLRAIVTASPEK